MHQRSSGTTSSTSFCLCRPLLSRLSSGSYPITIQDFQKWPSSSVYLLITVLRRSISDVLLTAVYPTISFFPVMELESGLWLFFVLGLTAVCIPLLQSRNSNPLPPGPPRRFLGDNRADVPLLHFWKKFRLWNIQYGDNHPLVSEDTLTSIQVQ